MPKKITPEIVAEMRPVCDEYLEEVARAFTTPGAKMPDDSKLRAKAEELKKKYGLE